MDDRATFPEGRVVVIFRHLLEAELVIVIGADPFGRVDRALFQRRIDIAAGDLLRHDAKLFNHLAGQTGNAHLHALEIVDGVDFLAEPAAHLHAGIAGNHAIELVLGVKLVQQRVAVALIEPGIGQARIEAEGDRGADRKGRVLADIVVGAGMAHFHRAGGDGIRRLQAGDDFAGCKHLNVEIAVGRVLHVVGNILRAAKDRIERFGERGGQPPCDLGIFLRDCRCRQNGCCRSTGTRKRTFFDE